MKTSNKLLIGTGICIILGIFSYAFVLRGAYQKALANPLSRTVKVDFKGMKYLNLEYSSNIAFEYGKKYEIEVNRDQKDSLRFDYQGDTLNLDATKMYMYDITIFCPQLPILKLNSRRDMNDVEDMEHNLFIGKSFQSGSFEAIFLKNVSVNFDKCSFDKIEIKSQGKTGITLNESNIKQLNLNLPKKSSLYLTYSNIQSRNIVLGDSCSVNISGKQSQIDFLK
jgi:hypothetical protein